jgi:alanyl-tRNA synthetase
VIGSHELRRMFLDFFRQRDHEIVASSPVVPLDDPSLLFTNAGMNQFKNIFLGIEKPAYRRAASVQKCIRASGKHNDLEDVGRDGRHHTFFEMMGNWSFGDYYKSEAICWAWEFVTGPMGLPEDRLWVSVYSDDEEARAVWADQVKIPGERIVGLGDIENGDMENFWAMGETGPSGPCSEIHYDYDPGSGRVSGRRTREDFERASGSGRIIELWNLVFMEFNREEDGSLVPLPAKNIDTGMGLERALAILQGVESNYETDLFLPLIEKVEELSGLSAGDPGHLVSFQVISDHARSLAFAVADGAIPSNEGRGYVLRRILRRAVRHGRLLGLNRPFLHLLVDPLVRKMGEDYGELVRRAETIRTVIQSEEELFLKTLDRGLEEFERAVERLQRTGSRVFPGGEAFVLHDTFGFPLDLTELMLRERNLELDMGGFEQEMDRQRKRAREASAFRGAGAAGDWVVLREEEKTEFTGYMTMKQAGMHLVRYREENGQVHLVFDRTPFYAEAGGQVGDTGTVEAEGVLLDILDVKKIGESYIHIGTVERGRIMDTVYTGSVDEARRRKIMANHTATHLLHHALKKVLGAHVAQAGSLVAPDRLRFDFNHYRTLSEEELEEIERIVNAAVLRNLPVGVLPDLSMEDALAMGAVALFGEKYGKRVRVVRIDDLSAELCGGTHAERTGDIGMFKILKESSISAGVRRIEAVTNMASLDLVQRNERIMKELSLLLGAGVEDLAERVRALREKLSELEKGRKRDRRKKAEHSFDPERHTVRSGDYSLVRMRLDGYTHQELREISDRIKSGLKKGVVFLASPEAVREGGGGKVAYVLAATEDAVKNGVDAGKLLQAVMKEYGGSGGGRPHLAQGGGSDPDMIQKAFSRLEALLKAGV